MSSEFGYSWLQLAMRMDHQRIQHRALYCEVSA